MKKKLQAKTLLLISSLAYLLAIGLSTDSIIGGAFALLGLIALLFGIIAHIKEYKSENKQNNCSIRMNSCHDKTTI